MQTSRPNGDNYLWRCVALWKGAFQSLGSETSYKGRRFQIRRGRADPHLPPSPPPFSPGKKTALKMKLPRVTTYSSSYKSQEQPCLLVHSRGCRKSSFLISAALIFLEGNRSHKPRPLSLSPIHLKSTVTYKLTREKDAVLGTVWGSHLG